MSINSAAIFMTRKCNNNCSHCNLKNNSVKNELNADEWINVMKILNNLGVKSAKLFGGEVTLVPRIEDIIRYISEKTQIEAAIITNSLVSEEKLKKIYNAGLKRIGTSLDIIENDNGFDYGSTKKSKSAWNMLNKLKTWGVPFLVANIVVNNKNYNQIPRIIELLSDKGIWAHVIPIHWANNGIWEIRRTDTTCELKFENNDVIDNLVNKLLRMKDEGYLIANDREYISEMKDYMKNLSWKCKEEPSILRIDSDGALMCCADRRGEVSNNFKVKDLGEQKMLEKFILMRKNDTKGCSGCYWPDMYQAERNGNNFTNMRL